LVAKSPLQPTRSVEEEAAGSAIVAASCVTSAPSIKTESEYGAAEGE
jgi:hypothetical protein